MTVLKITVLAALAIGAVAPALAEPTAEPKPVLVETIWGAPFAPIDADAIVCGATPACAAHIAYVRTLSHRPSQYYLGADPDPYIRLMIRRGASGSNGMSAGSGAQ